MPNKFPIGSHLLTCGIYSFICLLKEFSIALVNVTYTSLFSGRIKFTKGPIQLTAKWQKFRPLVEKCGLKFETLGKRPPTTCKLFTSLIYSVVMYPR
jgi:hypothetical protein